MHERERRRLILLLRRQSGAQRGLRRSPRRQAGDAELIALSRHRCPRHRRVELHPVLRYEIRAPRGRHGETDAGARRIGLALDIDRAHRHAGGALGVGQQALVFGIVGCACDHLFQRLHRLGIAVLRPQRLGQQQQSRDFALRVAGRAERLPGGQHGAVRVRWRAPQFRSREIPPLPRGRLAHAEALLKRGGGFGVVVARQRRRGATLGQRSDGSGRIRRKALVQRVGVALRIGVQAGKLKILRPRRSRHYRCE